MANAQKRILREYSEIEANPLEGVTVQPIEQDIFKWNIELAGPKGSPYAGGTFKLLLTLPENYPFKPPILAFQTKIYHPNVSNDDKGTVLAMARDLLQEANPDDAVETSIAEQYKNDKANYEKTAKQWTKQYAK